MKKYKGFSLIELMIVVAIIGILSLMAIPLYQDYITKINLTKLLSEHMHRVNSAMVEVRSAGDIRQRMTLFMMKQKENVLLSVPDTLRSRHVRLVTQNIDWTSQISMMTYMITCIMNDLVVVGMIYLNLMRSLVLDFITVHSQLKI